MRAKSSSPTLKTLQALLMRIGSASSGTKQVLLSRLARDLHTPLIPPLSSSSKSIRLLSIDMGIKNLAFCVADVYPPKKRSQSTTMSIQAWRRLDVAEETSKRSSGKKGTKGGKETRGEDEEPDSYTPSKLSKTAYRLLKDTLLPYNPDIILIERQRWRSAGGSAIQQWTVRVNTLEGMLWAILTAFRSESRLSNLNLNLKINSSSDYSYEIFDVDPKRVANFWIVLKKGEAAKCVDMVGKVQSTKVSRGKAEKKARIGLLRSWLTSSPPSTAAIEAGAADVEGREMGTHIRFEFSTEADATRKALCSTEKTSTRKRGGKESVMNIKKLDDVTDCFLQAAAWVAWEGNRVQIAEGWDTEKAILEDGGIVIGLGNVKGQLGTKRRSKES